MLRSGRGLRRSGFTGKNETKLQSPALVAVETTVALLIISLYHHALPLIKGQSGGREVTVSEYSNQEDSFFFFFFFKSHVDRFLPNPLSSQTRILAELAECQYNCQPRQLHCTRVGVFPCRSLAAHHAAYTSSDKVYIQITCGGRSGSPTPCAARHALVHHSAPQARVLFTLCRTWQCFFFSPPPTTTKMCFGVSMHFDLFRSLRHSGALPTMLHLSTMKVSPHRCRDAASTVNKRLSK